MTVTQRGTRPILLALGLSALLGGSCTGPAETTLPIRLVDRFSEATVEGSPPAAEPTPPTEWRFSGGKATGGTWAPGPRTAGLALGEEGLTGRAEGPQPTIFLELPSPAGGNDRLHEVVVRLRATAGSRFSLTALGADGPPSIALAKPPGPLTLSTPLIPGPDFQTYTIALDRTFGMGPLSRSSITRMILRPTDAAGAEFTLESVRLVFRKERLASIPTGIGWHGLAEIWRDTIVSRAPEIVSWSLELPGNPWLDIALGTVSDGAVGFDVVVTEPGRDPLVIYEETLTTSNRWLERRINLRKWAGRAIELSLRAQGEEGALAFWGSPVVRNGAAAANSADSARPRGVIVVLADTLRRDHLGVYGHARPNTPNLTRMAEEGVLFRDAISQGAWTKVSVPSILSSMYPTTHGIVSFNDRLPSVAVTLAEALQGAGYATWASSSVPFSGQLTNLHQGVEVLYESASLGSDSSKTGRSFVDRLVPWLERHRDVPFFAFVHAMDPHSPFEPYPPYDTVWTEPDAGPRYLEQMDQIRPHIESRLLRRFGMPTRQEMEAAGVEVEQYIEHERAWYDASILGLDAEVGRLFEVLRTLGRDRDTVVAFVSDHGEEFLEHGSHWHGRSVYAEMIEVPLILRWPGGLPGGQVVDTTVQTIDLMPTLLDLAGISIPDRAQGRTLIELWGQAPVTARRPPAIAERQAPPSSEIDDPILSGSDSVALVQEEWKLIWNSRQAAGVPEYELFHRPSDPLDQRSVAAENPDTVELLKDVLERWLSAAQAARLPSDADAEGELSAEELERLRSLGYI